MLPDLERGSEVAGRPGSGGGRDGGGRGGGGTASRAAEDGGWARARAGEIVGEFSVRWRGRAAVEAMGALPEPSGGRGRRGSS